MPLIKELETELGTAQSHHLVGRALGEVYRQMAAGWARKRGSLGAMQILAEVSYASDAIDAEERESSPTARAVDVTGCRYAEFFHQLGEPELGLLSVCSADFPIAQAIPGVDVERTRTIMQGVDFCDFRYHLSPDELAAPPNAHYS